MKKMICVAAAITIAFVIAIFAGSGEDSKGIGKGILNPQLESSLNAVPPYINYQGVLYESGQHATKGDTKSMIFKIYDLEAPDPTNETLLWSESHTVEIGDNGLVNALLGDGTPGSGQYQNLSDVFDGMVRYLEVVVSSQTLTPRLSMASVPYALNSSNTTSGDFWKLTGNAGTAPGNHFLGTTDDLPLFICANGVPGLIIEPNPQSSPNMIGGHYHNEVLSTVVGATISGGGGPDQFGDRHIVSDDYGTVGGGRNNLAGNYAGTTSDAGYATVCGGYDNVASEGAATVGGGSRNIANGAGATIPGGRDNIATGICSFAAGKQAEALNDNTFVWSDGTAGQFQSTGESQFLIHASGGVGIGKTNPQERLDVAGTVRMTGFKMPVTTNEGWVLTSDGAGVGTWQEPGGEIGGIGTTNYIPKFTDPNSLGNSLLYELDNKVGIGTELPEFPLDVQIDPTESIGAIEPFKDAGMGMVIRDTGHNYGAGMGVYPSVHAAGFGAAMKPSGNSADFKYFSLWTMHTGGLDDYAILDLEGLNGVLEISNRDDLSNIIPLRLAANDDVSTIDAPVLYSDGNAIGVKDVLRLQPRSSPPSSPSNGDLYVDDSPWHIYCFLNGTWKQLD